jgi:hypothetical protein
MPNRQRSHRLSPRPLSRGLSSPGRVLTGGRRNAPPRRLDRGDQPGPGAPLRSEFVYNAGGTEPADGQGWNRPCVPFYTWK